MSVKEAMIAGGIDGTLVQPVYLEPLPVWELEKYRGLPSIAVEMSSTGQFATLLREKAGLTPSEIVRKYDGRPFDPLELAADMKRALSAMKLHSAL